MPNSRPALTIEPRILSHPWYRKWECGELPVESLRHYAGEYYWQVANFPRYLSRLHSQLERVEDRRVVCSKTSRMKKAKKAKKTGVRLIPSSGSILPKPWARTAKMSPLDRPDQRRSA